MRKAARFLLWSFAGLIILTTGLFFYLQSADLSVYEEKIEGILSNAVGHKVDVDGLFEFRFGAHTQLVAEQIRVSNADWPSDPLIVSVDHLSVTVNLWSVFRRPIFIEQLDIRGIDVRLEKDAEQKANWESGKVADNVEETAKESASFNTNLIAFREVRIEDIRFVYADPARPRPLNATLEFLTINPGDNDILDLDLRAVINEYPLWADGKMGPWPNFVSGEDITADLNLTLGQLRLTVNGSIANLKTLQGVEMQLGLNGPAIDRITEALGMPRFAEGAFQLDTEIQAMNQSNQFKLDGNLGAIRLYASGNFDRFIGLQHALLDFNVSGPDTMHVVEVFGIQGAPAEPFQISGKLEMDGSRFQFSNTQARIAENVIGFDGWLDVSPTIPDGDITVGASGPDFSIIGPFTGLQGIPASAFNIDGRIQKTGTSWMFDDFNAAIGENKVAAHGSIGGQDGAESQIDIRISGPDNTVIQALTGLEGLPAKPFDISARVKPDPVGIRLEDASAVFGDNTIDIDGVVRIDGQLEGTKLTVGLHGPEFGNVSLLSGIPYMPTGPYEVDANIRLDNNALYLDDTTATVAGLHASVGGKVGIGADSGDFDLTLSLGGPDLAKLMESKVLDRMSGEAFEIGARVASLRDAYTFSDVSVTLGNLKVDADGSVRSSLDTGTVNLKIASPDSAILRKLGGLSDLPAGAVSIGGRIEKHSNNIELTGTEARIGEFVFAANGILSNAPLSNDSDLTFSASGPELHALGLPFGFAGLPVKSFSVAGHVNGVPTGFVVDRLVAHVGENDIDGFFDAKLGEKPEIKGTLSSSYIDLIQAESQQEAEAAAGEVTTTNSKFLFSDETFNFDWLDRANVDVTIRTDRVISVYGDFLDFQLGVKLWDRVLEITPLSFRDRGGTFGANFRLEPSDEAYSLNFQMDVENARVGLFGTPGQDPATLPPVAGEIEFRSTGTSLRELMVKAVGHISIYEGSGQVRNIGGSRLFGDLTLELLKVINPSNKAPAYTNVECGIIEVDLRNGIAKAETLAIQTDKMLIVSKGNITFPAERLSFTIQAVPREGLGISIGGVVNSLIKLGGTLKKPQLEIDPMSSATTTGVAVATGGLSLLAKGLWDRASAEKSICKEK